MFLDTPLSFDRGEVTDKGSVNQRAVLRERAGLVASLLFRTRPRRDPGRRWRRGDGA
jgi:hypothetical protein